MEQKMQETVAVHSVEINHLKKDMDHVKCKIDKMDTQIDNIEKMLAEIRGGKAAAMWIFSGIGIVLSALITWWINK